MSTELNQSQSFVILENLKVFVDVHSTPKEMTDYTKIKKLDEKSLEKLKEGTGPANECICPLLFSNEERRSLAASVKKIFKSVKRKSFGRKLPSVPGSMNKKSKGIYSKKEQLPKSSCRKCGCDKEKIVLKHSYANIRITTPDVSSICPCDTNCLPDKEKLQDNIKVVVE